MRGRNAGVWRVCASRFARLVGRGYCRPDGSIGGAAANRGAAERDPAELSGRLSDTLLWRSHGWGRGSELPATECRERFGALPAGAVGHRRRQRERAPGSIRTTDRIGRDRALRRFRSVRAGGPSAAAIASSEGLYSAPGLRRGFPEELPWRSARRRSCDRVPGIAQGHTVAGLSGSAGFGAAVIPVRRSHRTLLVTFIFWLTRCTPSTLPIPMRLARSPPTTG